MTQKKILLAFTLLVIGIIGVASILTMDIPLPAEAEAILKDRFTDQQIKLLTLVNPSFLLIIFIAIGTLLYDKVNLKVPFIEKLVGLRKESIQTTSIIKYGIYGGIISGILISIIALIYNPFLPTEFLELGENLKPTLASRFLYGGLTEEILMRFGLMTLIVWLFSKIFKGTKPFVFWIGIIISAFIFALGHFPIAFQTIENPSMGLLSYIIIGNSIGGIIFGWLYWKKGLESAFIAHVFTHIIMLIGEHFVK